MNIIRDPLLAMMQVSIYNAMTITNHSLCTHYTYIAAYSIYIAVMLLELYPSIYLAHCMMLSSIPVVVIIIANICLFSS